MQSVFETAPGWQRPAFVVEVRQYTANVAVNNEQLHRTNPLQQLAPKETNQACLADGRSHRVLAVHKIMTFV